MILPTLDHVFYIPLVLAAGALLGYWWGRRTLMIQLAENERAERMRADRRAQRHAKTLKADDDNITKENLSEDNDESDAIAP